jgi:hypothetical protein
MLSIVMISMFACHEDSSRLDVGIITGEDRRYCMCCGGEYITINSVTYRFDSPDIPAGHSFINFNNADLKFPISVYVKWRPKEKQCIGDEIIVTDLIPRPK